MLSPPANTFGMLVCRSSLTCIPPHLLTSIPLARSRNSLLGVVPIASITVSYFSVNSLPSIGIGLRRPLSSGSPSLIFIQVILFTQPSSPLRLTGFSSSWKCMPSSTAWSSSSSLAGASPLVLLYIMWVSAPYRRAHLAASIATLPAPITATLSPTTIGVSDSSGNL